MTCKHDNDGWENWSRCAECGRCTHMDAGFGLAVDALGEPTCASCIRAGKRSGWWDGECSPNKGERSVYRRGCVVRRLQR